MRGARCAAEFVGAMITNLTLSDRRCCRLVKRFKRRRAFHPMCFMEGLRLAQRENSRVSGTRRTMNLDGRIDVTVD